MLLDDKEMIIKIVLAILIALVIWTVGLIVLKEIWAILTILGTNVGGVLMKIINANVR